jgi:hypothetical protein
VEGRPYIGNEDKIVIPAKAGIQKKKITGFRIKCGMTEIR